MSAPPTLSGPDLAAGVPLADLPEGEPLLGHAGGEAIVLVRAGAEVRAVGATCTHYSGPLAEGLVVDGTIRCPWHHACFDLASGEALGPPALAPIPCYRVDRQGDRVIVGARVEPRGHTAPIGGPKSVVVVGMGAAGFACVEMLRRLGYGGRITLIGAEAGVPVDRPNLSKDYLAGTAPEEWIPLRGADWFAEQKIELVAGTRAARIDVGASQVVLDDGRAFAWDALVLATGSAPIRLPIPGTDAPSVHVLRSLADSRAIARAAAGKERAVVVGSSFIGLEVAASLRARGLAVDVVAPEEIPLARLMGPELGAFVRRLHEEKGVVFHLGRKPASFAADAVLLDDGTRLRADVIVAGVGVRPVTELAETAGCKVDRGVLVDAELRTSVAGIWAAGDVARFPDPGGDGAIRIEHWAVAERQGQVAARNVLGAGVRFDAVPFFWSQHYDVPIAYVGHVERWDSHDVHGSVDDRNCVVAYRVAGRVRAAASIYRDRESLAIEHALETDDQAAIERILAAVG